MNKKAVFTPLTVIFIDVVFIFLWFGFIGSFLTVAGNMYIETGAGGFEAFFFKNLNLLVFIALLLFNAIGFSWGGGD
jgi:hypothetical protein